ncbi:hypothetical protein GJAV_G00106570 [Gymnothorax javanicus]|nr:hypothetical protein GJAV_G00106570 [Gymnothorax javanicus]
MVLCSCVYGVILQFSIQRSQFRTESVDSARLLRSVCDREPKIEEMLAQATRNLVREIDPDGSLIPLRRLNDSDKLLLLALVLKRPRFWFWQKPKYRPSDFSLNHLLLEDEPISPGLVERNFLKYDGKFGDGRSGRLEGGVGPANLTMEGKGSSTLQSSFGNLRKQEVDVQKLLLASKDRKLNLEHVLLQQVRGRGHGRGRNVALAVLKERIISTQPCLISQQMEGLGSCSAMMSLITPVSVQVSVQENGSVQRDRNISMEIPEGTVIAYSVMELHIQHNGQFELCLQPDCTGRFEVDGPIMGNGEFGEHPMSILLKELSGLQAHFRLLAGLPAATRSDLLQNLKWLMTERETLGVLQNIVEEMLEGGGSSVEDLERLSSSQQLRVRVLLALLENAQPTISTLLTEATSPTSSALIRAVHLLLSSLEEMSDSSLAFLSTCCSPPVLKSLQDLVNGGMVNGESALANEEACQRVELLFSSSNMVLRRETGRLWAEPGAQAEPQPLVMCIAVLGLASLSTGL